MRSLCRIGLLGVPLLIASGCNVILPDLITVVLVNEGSFTVDVRLYTHDEQDVPESLIDDVGDERLFSIPAGQTVTFNADCDDLQAIMIADADLRVAGNVGPEASTGVFRDGSDFNCRDTLQFTFSHPPFPTELNIAFEAR